MRRALISLLAVLPLACAPAAAGAASAGNTGPCVVVTGTVVSVDGANHQFVASASVVPRSAGNFCPAPSPGPVPTAADRFRAAASLPAPTQVTITTDPNTKIRVNGHPGSVADLKANDRFSALYSGTPDEPIGTIVAGHVLALEARTPPRHHQLFAFVGTVTAVDPTAGTVTVSVTQSYPSTLVPAGSDPVSFTVDKHTMIVGANGGNGFDGGSLSGVQVGDLVAGAVLGWSDQTLAAVQALPLRLLLDLPVAGGGGGGAGAASQASVLQAVLGLADGHSGSVANHHKKTKTHKHHTHSQSKKSHAKHA